MKTPQAVVEAYLRGHLVLVGLLIELGGCLAEKGAAAFVAWLPKDLLDERAQKLDGARHRGGLVADASPQDVLAGWSGEQ
jgi:hypothetical protein